MHQSNHGNLSDWRLWICGHCPNTKSVKKWRKNNSDGSLSTKTSVFFRPTNTVKDGQKITQNFLGEHKVITPEQLFLRVILSFFMHLRWPWLSRFFA